MSLVEPITVADASGLVELCGAAGEFVTARNRSDYWLYARLFSHSCLCIRSDGRPVAVVIAFCDQTPEVNEIYVQDVAVHPGHRRRGHASALLAELRARAESWSVRGIWLTSEPDNEEAITLWRRLGFVNAPADYQRDGVWLTRDLKGPGRDRAVFRLDLLAGQASV